MKKLIGFIIVLAVIWAVPGLRNRVGVLALPLLERLGPVGERVAEPVENWKAKNQVKFYLRMIRDDATEGRPLPDARGFTQWTRRRFAEETGLDPWGNAYWLTRSGARTVTVGSNGADGELGTPDDVSESATF
jgi:hypothetical protein